MNLFGTAGIRGPIGAVLTPELAIHVGRAVATEARERGVDGPVPEVVLGRDGRTSSPAIADAVAAGLASGGVRVQRAGIVPTPALAFASRDRAGVMITASHNPPDDNGIKCFEGGEEYDADAEGRIEERVAEARAEDAGTGATGGADGAKWQLWTASERIDRLEAYRETVEAYAAEYGAEPDGLTVAVDCGNGASSLATPQVLAGMGADVRALEANVDGHFPARESKPTPESLGALRGFVPAVDADLGIGHDGDGDRIVIVDGEGDVVHEDTVLAILAEAYVEAHEADAPVVVTTPNASARVDERIAAAGGETERVRLGALHEGIAVSDGPVAFAAEPWKHIHPNLGPWIDGVASAAVFTRLVAAEGLDALRAPVTERPYRKVSVVCPADAKDETMATLEDVLAEEFPDATLSREHGLRLSFDDASWVLVRPSGTESYVRVYAESDEVDALVDAVVATVEAAVDRATK